MNPLFASVVVEIIGPFALMFAGGGAIIATQGENLVAIALAHGLAIGLMIAAAGHISGGVYNPAVSIALLAVGKLPPVKAAAYIVAQCLGCAIGALALKAVYPASAVDAVKLGTPLLGPGVGVGQGFLVEVILTFFLMFSIYGAAIDARGPAVIAGLVVGLTITMDVFAGGGLTGAAMNPARAFGPALVQGVWQDHWLYWLAPIIGALLAALLYHFALLEAPEPKREPPVELPQPEVGR
jgi:MIP family channel proteins